MHVFWGRGGENGARDETTTRLDDGGGRSSTVPARSLALRSGRVVGTT